MFSALMLPTTIACVLSRTAKIHWIPDEGGQAGGPRNSGACFSTDSGLPHKLPPKLGQDRYRGLAPELVRLDPELLSLFGEAPRALVCSQGCKTNQYEAEACRQRLQTMGFTSKIGFLHAEEEYLQSCQLVILNSCTVTAEAGRKARQFLRRIRRNNPEAILGVMGCEAELHDMDDLVDVQGGTRDRLAFLTKAVEAVKARQRRRLAEGLTSLKETNPLDQEQTNQDQTDQDQTNFEDLGLVVDQTLTRGTIKIEDGCNRRCSYCAICLARGPVRSRDKIQILKEARALLASGVEELVLTGIHLCSYGLDWGQDSMALVELCDDLAALPGRFRIRLGSLEPHCMTPPVIQGLVANPKLAPYFHLSLQAGCNATLRKMGRDYTKEEYAEVVEGIREYLPEAGFGTDWMVGFPYESAADFEESRDFIADLALSRLHVFPYSPRVGTLSARWPQIAATEVSRRATEAGILADQLAQDFAQAQQGRTITFLGEMEAKNEEKQLFGAWQANTPTPLPGGTDRWTLISGYSGNYLPALILMPLEATGKLVQARILGASEGRGLGVAYKASDPLE